MQTAYQEVRDTMTRNCSQYCTFRGFFCEGPSSSAAAPPFLFFVTGASSPTAAPDDVGFF
jgi:hypothetical protein